MGYNREALRQDFRDGHSHTYSFLGNVLRGLHTAEHIIRGGAMVAGAVKRTVDIVKGNVPRPRPRPPIPHPFGMPRFWGIYHNHWLFCERCDRHPWRVRPRPRPHLPPMVPLGHRHHRW